MAEHHPFWEHTFGDGEVRLELKVLDDLLGTACLQVVEALQMHDEYRWEVIDEQSTVRLHLQRQAIKQSTVLYSSPITTPLKNLKLRFLTHSMRHANVLFLPNVM